jgi:hypothetical protein
MGSILYDWKRTTNDRPTESFHAVKDDYRWPCAKGG